MGATVRRGGSAVRSPLLRGRLFSACNRRRGGASAATFIAACCCCCLRLCYYYCTEMLCIAVFILYNRLAECAVRLPSRLACLHSAPCSSRHPSLVPGCLSHQIIRSVQKKQHGTEQTVRCPRSRTCVVGSSSHTLRLNAGWAPVAATHSLGCL